MAFVPPDFSRKYDSPQKMQDDIGFSVDEDGWYDRNNRTYAVYNERDKDNGNRTYHVHEWKDTKVKEKFTELVNMPEHPAQ